MKKINFINPILHRFNRLFEATPNTLRPFRWPILIFATLATVFMIYGMVNHLKMNMSLDSWFQDDDATKIALDKFRQEFGSDDGLYVVYRPKDGDVFSHESLRLIHDLSKELLYPEGIEGVGEDTQLNRIEKVTSLTNSNYQIAVGDELISRKMITEIVPKSQEKLNELRKIALSQDGFLGAFFSKDHKYGGLQIKTDFGSVPLDKSLNSEKEVAFGDEDVGDFSMEDPLSTSAEGSITEEKIEFEPVEMSEYVGFMDDIKKLLNQPKYSQHFDFYPVGNASMMDFAMKSMDEAGILLLIMILIIIGLLWSLLKSFNAVVWPVVIILISTCWTIGGAAWLGVEVDTMVSMTAMLIITIGVADCVHIMSTYLIYRREEMDHEEALTQSYRKTGIPVLITSITTMCGMLALTVSGLPQFVVFGIMSAAGVGCAWFFTWTLLPACLDLWHPMKGIKMADVKVKTKGLTWFISAGWIQPLLNKIPGFVSPRPLKIAIFFLGLLALFSYGMSQVKVNTNIVELTEKGSELRIAYELVDEQMMGAQNMEIMLDFRSADALKDPRILQAIDDLEQRLITQYPQFVKKTFSLAGIIKDTNRVMNNGDQEFYRVPKDRLLNAQLMFLFSNANPEDRSSLVDDNFEKTHISVMLKNSGSYEYRDFFQNVAKDIDEIFSPLKESYTEFDVVVTGSLALIMELSQTMSESQLNSFLFAIVIISLIMILTLGSLQGGVISILPNVIPAVFTFGMMGLMDVSLDADTMIIAPLIIGIAVDDTIHFITHYRDALMQGSSVEKALRDTIKEVGQAITFTSMILGFGFVVLSFSGYGGLSKMGVFGSMGIFVALICDLILMPSLICIFKPKMGTQKEELERVIV